MTFVSFGPDTTNTGCGPTGNYEVILRIEPQSLVEQDISLCKGTPLLERWADICRPCRGEDQMIVGQCLGSRKGSIYIELNKYLTRIMLV
jgi:hypothetical protein